MPSRTTSRTAWLCAGLVGTLALLAAFVGLGVTYDTALTRWAATLTPEITGFFARVTQLGASGYVFFLTIATLLVSIAFQRTGLGRRRDAARQHRAARKD